MSSLRRDLVIALAAGIGSTNLLAGALVFALVRANSHDDFDAALQAKAGALATLMQRTQDGIELDFADEVMPEFHRPQEPEYFQVWVDAAVLERSLSLGERDLPRRTAAPGRPEHFDLVLPDGRPGRAVGMVVPVDYADSVAVDRRHPAPLAELVVAVGRSSLDAGDRRILHALLVTALAVTAAGLLVVAIAWRRFSRRIGDLTGRLSRLDADSLEGPLPADDLASELRPIADTLNVLLERLRRAFARERRMTANVAHELRTPVAELRTAVDVALRWPDDPSLARDAIRAAGSVAERMSASIETLLRLGRLQSGRYVVEPAAVDVGRVIDETRAALATDPGRRDAAGRVELSGVRSCVVKADAELLGVLVRNLLENAFAHANGAGPIRSELRRSRRVTRWTLSNSAGTLTAAEVRSFGEPFWQKPGAPAGTAHHGLGISLCQAVCRALGWRLRFRLEDGRLLATTFMRDV